jgi:pimeloyl-ACP methyl ester carboxylesterase
MTRTARIRHVLRWAATLTAALSVAAVTVVAPVGTTPAHASAGATCARTNFGDSTPPERAADNPTRRPVVFVHGWTGRVLTGLGQVVAAKVGDDIQPMVFDYSKWSAYWASDDHIAPCLADYLNAVSAAYAGAGGDGRLIYVAHSLGGLAIRYALAGT